MKINALTVCVDYADFMALGVERWRPHFDTWTVVTTHRDAATERLAKQHGLRLVQTDVFYAKGAAFNKGAAMEMARRAMPWHDWILFLDSDIVPEVGWYAKTVEAKPVPGNIYSAWRHETLDPAKVDDPALPRITTDGLCVGYFQLFHSSDPHAQGTPLLDMHWRHAGIYDSRFKDRWPAKQRKPLPIRLVHVGERDNWLGRGKRAEFEAMMAERRVRGGYEHEQVEV